jgi:hypothetical protein
LLLLFDLLVELFGLELAFDQPIDGDAAAPSAASVEKVFELAIINAHVDVSLGDLVGHSLLIITAGCGHSAGVCGTQLLGCGLCRLPEFCGGEEFLVDLQILPLRRVKAVDEVRVFGSIV